jgi:putative hydrolase of the HAD superfamily
MCFEVMFFDLDDTLYPSTTGIWQAIGFRMDQYMREKMGLLPENVEALREDLYKRFGTTLRGLREVYCIDETEFLNFVHDIPIHNYLKQDSLLAETLSMYPQRKVIFTNADFNHASRVLKNLGVVEFFENVIDIHRVHPYCKPMSEAFNVAIEAVGIEDPAKCVMIDDSYRNLVAAHNLGFYTILVGATTRAPEIDATILSIYELPSVIPASFVRSKVA